VSTTPVANLPPVSTTPAANFASSFSRVVDTGGKFATGVADTGGKQWDSYQAEDTLKWTWRQKFIYMVTLLSKGVPTKLLKFFWLKIFSFATSVSDTGGQPWAANISANFGKNLKWSQWDTLELGGN
jgi:hypothetical protein